jgi:hypothetical protein
MTADESRAVACDGFMPRLDLRQLEALVRLLLTLVLG